MSKITEQQGIASSTPSPLKRWFLSKLMTYVISERNERRNRRRREAKRRREGRKHVIEYFHQVDDGYSHLAIQVLAKLKAMYDVELVTHVTPALRDANFPEPDLLRDMSRRDAEAVAPHYGLEFPEGAPPPRDDLIALATGILCNLDADAFASAGPRIGACLWRGDEAGLRHWAEVSGAAPDAARDARVRAGAERRKALKHYSGAMFWYEGEWYWGVDRLHHLEARLRALGAMKDPNEAPIAPRPKIPSDYGPAARELTLEFYPSLRSPYTAVAWDQTLKLARNSGVRLVMRPVLPMVMRGVPATFEKAFYAFKDAAREARAMKVDFGNFHDPIGEPILRGYSLYMWALGQGKGNALLGSFLKAAFARGIDTTRRSGLQKVVAMAGLDWREAERHLRDESWREPLEENRRAMYGFGSWGVPSYRLLDAEGREILGVWGQDRLWLVSRKIEERAR